MTRVLIGDALVNENERLQRTHQPAAGPRGSHAQAVPAHRDHARRKFPSTYDAAAHANLLVCYVIGRWQQFAKSGFTRDPMEFWTEQWKQLVPA